MAQATKALPGEGGLHVTLVTPTGAIASERTDAVIAPGELGEFEVLPGHIPFLTELHPGVLTIGENRAKKMYAVGIGFLEVSPKAEVRILVERAVAADKIDTAAAKAELDDSARLLAAWTEGPTPDWYALRARQAWAQAQLDARKLSGAGGK